ncbi:MAG TPA: hypothetical protein VHE55_05330 [Fimbriimonadaceae bacterium]|nr:hypothetical protein [Fimbriimonadaceae bacterium]
MSQLLRDRSIHSQLSEIVAFQRARTIIQRLADARIFNGWIRHVSPTDVIVHLQTRTAIEPKDVLSFQIFGNKKNAHFQAVVTAAQANEYGAVFAKDGVRATNAVELFCEVMTKLCYDDAVENPRFCVEGSTADIVVGAERHATGAPVIDVGPRGFAVLTDREFVKGQAVSVAFYASGVAMDLEANVRNCVAFAPNPSYQRVGFEIVHIDRLNLVRWRQFYASVLEANKADWSIENMTGYVVRAPKKAA